MPEVNEAIVKMLQRYSEEVARAATRALRAAADQMPAAGVAEQLLGEIRQAVRNSEQEA